MKLLPSWPKFLYHWSFFNAASLETSRLGDAKVGPEHVLCGLVSQGQEVTRLFDKHHATLSSLRQACREVELSDTTTVLGHHAPLKTTPNLRGLANYRAVLSMTPKMAQSRLVAKGATSSIDALLQLLSLPNTRIKDILGAANVDADALAKDAELTLTKPPRDLLLGAIVARRLTNHSGRRAIHTKQRFTVSADADDVKSILRDSSCAATVWGDPVVGSTTKNPKPATYVLQDSGVADEQSIRWELHIPAGKRSPSYSQYHQFTVTDGAQGCLVDHVYEFELPTWPPVPTWYAQLAVVLIPQRIAHFVADRQTSPR